MQTAPAAASAEEPALTARGGSHILPPRLAQQRGSRPRSARRSPGYPLMDGSARDDTAAARRHLRTNECGRRHGSGRTLRINCCQGNSAIDPQDIAAIDQSLPEKTRVLCPPGTQAFRELFLRLALCHGSIPSNSPRVAQAIAHRRRHVHLAHRRRIVGRRDVGRGGSRGRRRRRCGNLLDSDARRGSPAARSEAHHPGWRVHDRSTVVVGIVAGSAPAGRGGEKKDRKGIPPNHD